MAYAWSKLGMVLPIKTENGEYLKANGATVFVEQERDPALNRAPAKAR